MKNVLPNIYKGIALFTPGGDLVYGIDPDKQAQWHSHLCFELQKKMGLADSPHFLVPGYTATVERWLDPRRQEIRTIAEVYPIVQKHIPLLQVLFELKPGTQWQVAPWQEEHCNRAVIETYKPHFPKLWKQQNLIINLNRQSSERLAAKAQDSYFPLDQVIQQQPIGYVLRLFIASQNPTAEKTLSSIHQLLEQGLTSPYTLKVIDISQNPEQAVIHQIEVTPTLVRVIPKPVKRIVGQFDDIPRVLKIIASF